MENIKPPTKDKYIHVRIEENFKNEVQRKAAKQGFKISTLVNHLLYKWLKEN